MSEKKIACAITMVRDDFFFLEKWVEHYGGIFGRDALYVINHGGDPQIAEIAQGCTIINIPDVFDGNFDASRWRLLRLFANGLRGYFNFVIVVDVDEFLVLDPKTGMTLDEFLNKRKGSMTLTPVGLEVVHLPDQEPEPITDHMLGPRRFARFTTTYSKPCIFNHHVSLARGGHYADDPNLRLFRNLYLFHMRFVDRDLYVDTAQRRGAQMKRIENEKEGKLISRNWRVKDGKPDPYQKVAALPVSNRFDLSAEVDRMKKSWAQRDDTNLWAFEREIGQTLYTLPERFFGLV